MGASSSIAGGATTVAFCISTYQRPAGLARLLGSIATLVVPEGVSIRVVVVDNDADASAREVVEAAGAGVRWPLAYVVEARRGIPFARNRSLTEAGAVDFVSFVDDDEELDPQWLSRMLDALRRHDADAVICPVVAVFDEPAPAWVVAGGFFDRVRFATGERIPAWATDSGASLVRRGSFRGDHDRFDEGFLTGSDRLFFTKLERDGGRIVWADDTWIREFHPPSRATARWLVRRAYRTGNVRSLVTMVIDRPGPWRRVRRAGFGVSRIVSGIVLTIVGVVRGREHMVFGMRRVANGLGLIAGVAGVRFNEYRAVHGS
jgi:succinoglycan biosynthesis protein ExoM